MHPNTFLKIVQSEAGLQNLDDAKLATQVVFSLLHNRITRNEAKDLQAQLPKALANLWAGGDSWLERVITQIAPQNDYNWPEFLAQVEAECDDLPVPAETLTKAVFYALQSQITPGEASDVESQLPKDLKAIWRECSPLARPVPAGGIVENEAGLPPGLEEIEKQ